MRCPKCLGVGKTRMSPYHVEICPLCDGLGVVNHRVAHDWILLNPKATMAKRIFEQETKMPCLDCGGTGSVSATKRAEQRARLQLELDLSVENDGADGEGRTRKPEKG